MLPPAFVSVGSPTVKCSSVSCVKVIVLQMGSEGKDLCIGEDLLAPSLPSMITLLLGSKIDIKPFKFQQSHGRPWPTRWGCSNKNASSFSGIFVQHQ